MKRDFYLTLVIVCIDDHFSFLQVWPYGERITSTPLVFNRLKSWEQLNKQIVKFSFSKCIGGSYGACVTPPCFVYKQGTPDGANMGTIFPFQPLIANNGNYNNSIGASCPDGANKRIIFPFNP